MNDWLKLHHNVHFIDKPSVITVESRKLDRKLLVGRVNYMRHQT